MKKKKTSKNIDFKPQRIKKIQELEKNQFNNLSHKSMMISGSKTKHDK